VNTFLRITLPLAAVNFLNQASRVILALIGPLIALEFALSASDLGLLAAVLFVAYAAAQLPVGIALDVFGARRVQTVLTLTAALGFFLCAFSAGPLMLGVGRFITGIGISAGLMAMLKANAQWFPRARVAAMTGSGIFVGALGGMMATLPMQSILPLVGWRGGFMILGVMALMVAVWIWVSVADAPPGTVRPARRGMLVEVAAFAPIFAHADFIRFVPAIVVLSMVNFVYSGLWAGPWLRDVGGLDDAARALVLLCYAGGMAVGSIAAGQASSFLQVRGASAMLVPMVAVGAQLGLHGVFILAPPGTLLGMALIWASFAVIGAGAPVGYSAVGQRFGAELAGRVATAINATMLVMVFVMQYVIGAILDLWPQTAAGGWDPAGYGWAMGLTALMLTMTLLWAWRAPAVLRPSGV